MKEFSVILSTVPDEPKAREIAQDLVSNQLAACVNIVPGVLSVYRWRGIIESSTELLLVIKTRSSLAASAMAKLRELHPYEVPEAIELAVESGLKPYLDWLADETPVQDKGRSV